MATLTLLGGCVSSEEGSISEVGEVSSELGIVYQVGPGKPYADLRDVAGRLTPGDTVEIHGRSTPYPGGILLTRSGTAADPIRIVGVRGPDGRRPAIAGGTNTIEAQGHHTTFEGLDLSGGSSRVFFHHANGIVIRDSKIHSCPAHGILGADTGSGSMTVEFTEVTGCGYGTQKHPIYMATDQLTFPGAVFKLRYSWIHDNVGGNAVKSRAERNEITYNWLEGAYYRELELIGPDEDTGVAASFRREDSDVVGNVFVKRGSSSPSVRIGGDGPGGGSTSGRYRFAWNVFLQSSASTLAIQGFDRVEAVELHNNVFYRQGGGSVRVLSTADVIWASGAARISGSRNWIATGSTYIPSGMTGTITGSDPGFTNLGAWDLKPRSGSPLINAAAVPTTSPSGYAFPSPLATPAGHATRGAVTAAVARPSDGVLDIGAFEGGSSTTVPPPPPPPPPPPSTCVTASATGTRVVNTSMPSKTGTFTIEADATPTAATSDVAFALSRGVQSTWTGFAANIVLQGGTFKSRNGGGYTISSIPYVRGSTYHLRMVVDVAARRYSAYVTPPGGSELTIGTNLAFRTEQATVSSLDNWAAFAPLEGAIQVCNVVIR